MTPSTPVDVVIIGSGASAAAAAHALIASGRSVCMVDAGYDDDSYRQLIPDLPFSAIRSQDASQASYFLGRHGEGVPQGNVRVGAQLTPPRQFIQAGCETWLPIQSDTFAPMQSLALGGLAAGWGAACFTFSDWELAEIGIDAEAIGRYYADAARLIGLSGELDNDLAPFCARHIPQAQNALEIDSNGQSLLRAYMKKRARLNRRGFYLGRPLLAALSQGIGERAANPYFDMEFWSDARRSVFRPRYLIEELRRHENFTYLPGRLAVRFHEPAAGSVVTLHGIHIADGAPWSLECRQLMLCAGALNSARIAMNSLALCGYKTPLLSSPYVYIPALNLRMLGQIALDKRHSLTQLGAIYSPADGSHEHISLQIYSYRSLLLFKLIKEIPLPVSVARRLTRLVLNSLTITGAFYPDRPGPEKWLQIAQIKSDALPVLHASYQEMPGALARLRTRNRAVAGFLRALGCIPFMQINPGNGASIHYAGTIPKTSDPAFMLRCGADDVLAGTSRVIVADSASWRYLPAKGLTFTVIANALRIATALARRI